MRTRTTLAAAAVLAAGALLSRPAARWRQFPADGVALADALTVDERRS
jgi:hypothetical protein